MKINPPFTLTASVFSYISIGKPPPPSPLPPFPLPLFDLVYAQDKYKRLEARPSFGERRWNAISKEYSLLKLKKSGSSWLKPFCPLLWSYFVKEHYIAKWSPVKELRWERLKSNNIPFLVSRTLERAPCIICFSESKKLKPACFTLLEYLLIQIYTTLPFFFFHPRELFLFPYCNPFLVLGLDSRLVHFNNAFL